nr:MAG TPA: hypothetical protein [Caudoviricetes sp.]
MSKHQMSVQYINTSVCQLNRKKIYYFLIRQTNLIFIHYIHKN